MGKVIDASNEFARRAAYMMVSNNDDDDGEGRLRQLFSDDHIVRISEHLNHILEADDAAPSR